MATDVQRIVGGYDPSTQKALIFPVHIPLYETI